MNLLKIFRSSNDEGEIIRFAKFISENASDIILIVTAEGRIQYANEAACNHLGYGKEEFEQLTINNLDPELKENYWMDPSDNSIERVFTTKSGKNLAVNMNGVKWQGLSENFVCFIIKLLREEEKRENPLKYQLLAEHSTDMITRHNPDGTCTYASPSCQRIMGYLPEEIVGHTNFHFIYEDDIASVQDLYPEILSKPFVKTATYRVKHKQGHLLWVESTCQAIKDPHGEVMEIYATTRDISERKMFEKQLIEAKEKAIESDRLKTAFLQDMSHEIRTPMNAIMGFSDLLVEHLESKDKLQHFSEIISKRSNDLLEIINDILDIARIESGQLKINYETLPLAELLDDLKKFFKEHQVKLKKENIAFDFVIAPGSKAMLTTDPVKFKQIFINLIGNAFKFTQEGKIEGGVFMDNNQLTFYVSDTGLGIPEDKHNYIFERFSQLYSPESKNQGGTGLGLPIVKGLVELMGGKIWLNSKPGEGTTFYFTLGKEQK